MNKEGLVVYEDRISPPCVGLIFYHSYSFSFVFIFTIVQLID